MAERPGVPGPSLALFPVVALIQPGLLPQATAAARKIAADRRRRRREVCRLYSIQGGVPFAVCIDKQRTSPSGPLISRNISASVSLRAGAGRRLDGAGGAACTAAALEGCGRNVA